MREEQKDMKRVLILILSQKAVTEDQQPIEIPEGINLAIATMKDFKDVDERLQDAVVITDMVKFSFFSDRKKAAVIFPQTNLIIPMFKLLKIHNRYLRR